MDVAGGRRRFRRLPRERDFVAGDGDDADDRIGRQRRVDGVRLRRRCSVES